MPILLQSLILEFPQVGNKEVAPDYLGIKSLIDYMQDTYDMEFKGYNKGSMQRASSGSWKLDKNGEYIFKRSDGRWFFYTLKDLRDLGAPIELKGMYASPGRKQKPYKRS